jgi:hypothetical protein
LDLPHGLLGKGIMDGHGDNIPAGRYVIADLVMMRQV